MREILFRGKRVDNGEWITGYYIKANHHWHSQGIHEDWIVVNTIQNGGWCNVRGKYAVIPETIGQYTGLTDKNNKKIFEGDFVKISGDLAGIYVSVWEEYNFEYEFDNKEMSFGLCCVHSDDIEVIGNIYDNQKLINN